MRDYTKYVWENIKHRRMRSWLTMIGIFIGIAAVVSLLSLGQGLQTAVGEQFNTLGTDKIFILPGSSVFGSFAGVEGIELTDEDIAVIKRVGGVKLVAGFVYKIARVEYRGESKYTWVVGLPLDENREVLESISTFRVVEGRDLKESDTFDAIMPVRFAEGDFFEKKVSLRDTIKIEGRDFKIVGRLNKIGNPQDDSQVLIPIETAREVLNEEENYGYIMVQVNKGENAALIAEQIKERLRDHRNVDEREEDFTLQTSEQLIETFSDIFSIVTAVIIGIAAISLLVGGIGIMNTMYTAVLQRTREIGVMKAIGAKNSDVMKIFLIESGFYGLIGGSVGIIFGVIIAKLVAAIGSQYIGEALLQARISPTLLIGSLMFSFLVGAVSGLAPAYQASQLNPVEALRYE